MRVAKAFTTTTDTWVQTSPWNTGSTDELVGDGQVANDGKHPFKIGGVETATGAWEVMGCALLVSDGTGFGIAVNPDSRNEKKGAVADGVVATAACMPLKEGYTLNLQMVCGLILEKDVGGSSTTGTGDYFYVNVNDQTVKGTIREVLFLGSLGDGTRLVFATRRRARGLAGRAGTSLPGFLPPAAAGGESCVAMRGG